MKTTNLRAYIGKRIRILRIQKNMTQQQLEEYADLPLKYAYKLENLEPNIKIQTLEKIMSALDTDVETFFDVSLKENNPLTNQLLSLLAELPKDKQERLLKLMINLIEEVEK
ncbi:helix-turn-helix domain-containing protein [Streptococcus suis]|uniref:helix-turn-helix domain-containing protein n=1 Tax=Streptococcus suis TaxID=1307 RepID=UPI000CF60754|nr:helix-turn-helix transcriptional regulator [Streptococcus suis]